MHTIDEAFRALADPTRRAILRALHDGPLNAGQLAARLAVAPNALSFHLRVLRMGGLLRDERMGRFIRYGLNSTVLAEFARIVNEHIPVQGPPEPSPPETPARPPAPRGTRPEQTSEQDEDIALL